MNVHFLIFVVVVLAALPCALFLVNLRVYRPFPRTGRLNTNASADLSDSRVSVLIPARNEERNIEATLEAVLANRGAFEVIVLDDHSSDRTAGLVRRIADRDRRVRLESARPLPRGWCGKQFACHQLAELATHEILVFLDADVRLAGDALGRMVEFMRRRNVALASGVPCQEVGSFSEKLLLPLIHFVLLSYLPLHIMRRTLWPAMSGGCGQLFIASKDAYKACGGHAELRESMHDGIKLPRIFRRAGFRTDLFDATDVASCRMYRSNAETWHGLGKNAAEGLGAPRTIIPVTCILVGGNVLPFILLAGARELSPFEVGWAVAATVLALLPRLIAVRRFRQPVVSTLLHPAGVLCLLFIQWRSFLGRLVGKPAEWKGRVYGSRVDITAAEGL